MSSINKNNQKFRKELLSMTLGESKPSNCKNARHVLEYLGVDFECYDNHIHYTYPNKYSFSNYLYKNIDLLYQFLPEKRIHDIEYVLDKVNELKDGFDKLESFRNEGINIKDKNDELIKDKDKYLDIKCDELIRTAIERQIKRVVVTNDTNKAFYEYLNDCRDVEHLLAIDSRICIELIDSIESHDDYKYSYEKVYEGMVWTPSDGLLRLIKYMDANKENQ